MLSRRHAVFDRLSPQVGEIDETALQELLGSDPDAALAALSDMAAAVDEGLRRLARRLAAQTIVRITSPLGKRRGVGRLAPVRGVADGDLDLDRTLDRTGGLALQSGEDIVTRTWTAERARLLLLIDRSGSMSGGAVARAAMAAAAVSVSAADRVDHGIIAFARDRIVLKSIDRSADMTGLIDDILSLRGHGTTDVDAALGDAALQLSSGEFGGTRRVLVLSDCIATEGLSPQGGRRGIDRIDVITPASDTESLTAARRLASPTDGRVRVAESITDVARAVSELLV